MIYKGVGLTCLIANLAAVTWYTVKAAQRPRKNASPLQINTFVSPLSFPMTQCSAKQASSHLFGSAGALDAPTASNSLQFELKK